MENQRKGRGGEKVTQMIRKEKKKSNAKRRRNKRD